MAFRGERALAIVGVVAVAVFGFDAVTYAATGSSLLLGHSNTEKTTTTIKNSGSGAALNLQTKATTSAPFTTNAKGRVANLYASRALNADTLSGHTYQQTLNAAAAAAPTNDVWAAQTDKFTTDPMSGGQDILSVNVPAGSYVVTSKLYALYSAAAQPSDTFNLLCYLYSGSTMLDIVDPDYRPASSGSEIEALQGVTTVAAPTTLTLHCSGNGAAIDVWFPRLMAQKVSAIH